MSAHRQLTRKQRYEGKKHNASALPVSICCINFIHDGNLGYLIRSAACFGVEVVYVIGSVPERSALNSLSGSLFDYVKIKQYKDPLAFLNFAKSNRIKIVSAELCEDSMAIDSYDFDFSSNTILVVGNETSGIPVEILKNSDKIYIPMPGVGYCLNTSQAANILLYEASTQYHKGTTNETFKVA
jgi:tRNA G18 (ribose-2'-O)-methylase SpoU